VYVLNTLYCKLTSKGFIAITLFSVEVLSESLAGFFVCFLSLSGAVFLKVEVERYFQKLKWSGLSGADRA